MLTPPCYACFVQVCWCGDLDFYQGRIASYSKETGKHVVGEHGFNEHLLMQIPDITWVGM